MEPPADDAPVVVRSSAFGVAPNPAHEQFTVRYRFADEVQNGSVCLRDITGRLVLQEPLAGGEGNAVLATGHMGRGAYLLEVRGNGVVVHKEKILLE
ncbi:MAG: T9SS type A sorting domain-containing protein [Flavobacteriales bacterium]|nr:T9SS type A sorting domain-containing protein [Flavobacteriales bacterium]